MRSIKFIPLFILVLICASAKNLTFKKNQLNGTWVPIRQELGGTVLPGVAFEKQQLVISDSTYTFTAESVDKGVVKYSNGKMDIYGREGVNSGKHFTAIYKYKKGRLTICYNLAGNGYPGAFETKNHPAFFLSEFKKEN
jgi:uncharacterized protein (TIGR03067 family)